ncbi:MAG TPA: LCP family protein, partial [Patescibacteria group bacterium]
MVNESSSPARIFLKTILLTLLFLGLFIFLTLTSLSIFAYRQLLTFTSTAGITPPELFSTIRSGLAASPTHTNNHKNILLLGVDALETRGTSQPLTDTMIIASLDLKSGHVRTISLPRDLWSAEYQTKINALYFYGQERNPNEPAAFPTEVIQELTGVQLHHTLVLSMEQVGLLIDLIGGIEVEVPQSFTDPQFPRPEVDVTVERDPAKLYQTVSFEQGTEHMTGERALQFIRSRHAEGEEGSDVARSHRQQLVIQSLMRSLLDKKLLANPEKLGQLYRFYQENFAAALPMTEAIATAKTLVPVLDQIRF